MFLFLEAAESAQLDRTKQFGGKTNTLLLNDKISGTQFRFVLKNVLKYQEIAKSIMTDIHRYFLLPKE